MRRNRIILAGGIFAGLLLTATACSKPAPLPPPPPPPSAAAGAIEQPPAPKPQPPRIESLTAEPASIERGQYAVLRWQVTNANAISIDQNLGAVSANGTLQVSPANTTTYTLTARNTAGTASRSATVAVTAALPPLRPPNGPAVTGAEMLNRDAQDAYFDYGRTDLREDARQALSRDADLIKRILVADSQFNVVIEGHCDERGSAEYNLGLGDGRATSAKQYLVQLGVPSDRIRTLSYGKERPVCTDANENCYQRNRRAHLAPAP